MNGKSASVPARIAIGCRATIGEYAISTGARIASPARIICPSIEGLIEGLIVSLIVHFLLIHAASRRYRRNSAADPCAGV